MTDSSRLRRLRPWLVLAVVLLFVGGCTARLYGSRLEIVLGWSLWILVIVWKWLAVREARSTAAENDRDDRDPAPGKSP